MTPDPTSARGPVWIAVGRDSTDGIVLVDLTGDGIELSRERLDDEDALVARVSRTNGDRRWVWNDTRARYPALLSRGIEVARCRDLRLCHAVVRTSLRAIDPDRLRAATLWDCEPDAPADVLFDLPDAERLPSDIDEICAEFRRQQRAVAGDDALRLLLAAESAGALLAVEMHAAGLPWDATIHDRILVDVLGPRPVSGGRPERIDAAAAAVRAALGDPAASLDSPPRLLRALHRVGVPVASTSKWELAEHDHPVIAPLLEYKRLTRLLSANGWHWQTQWAPAGRFRPVYVPGGVVTGRWASSGGGALQLPRLLRPAVRADPGWVLVVADVAQLEPRVLAAMAGDTALADAARGTDLYQGIVAAGVVPTRQEAKIALLGAMYGSTTGDSGRLVPALRRAYPRAMALVDEAARVGERGGIVSTWLGRSSPAPSQRWRSVQARAGDIDATETDRSGARHFARDRGRFTRNFVVQGTAAEWASVWLAEVRRRLASPGMVTSGSRAPRSGLIFDARAHLAFFLHDEIIVHAPQQHAEAAAQAVVDAAKAATTLLFATFPLDFPLDLRIGPDAAKAESSP